MKDINLTALGLLLTALLAGLGVHSVLQHAGDEYRHADVVVVLSVSFVFLYGSFVYLFARLGRLLRIEDRNAIVSDECWGRARVPPLTILIPSYREERPVIAKTIFSACLQSYPNKQVVLLIDDSPAPGDEAAAALLSGARDVVAEANARMGRGFHRAERFRRAFLRRLQMGPASPRQEAEALAGVLRELANWLVEEFPSEEPSEPMQATFQAVCVRRLATAWMKAAEQWERKGGTAEFNLAALSHAYDRLVACLAPRVSSFERKRYTNLSHEPNKAMNLNSYIGLMGRSWAATSAAKGLLLVPHEGAQSFSVADPDYILTLDADSVIAADYASKLIGYLEGPDGRDCAVAQTPYTAFPGPPGVLERIAGATTDIQYFVHQGFTQWSATFWVGANAILRKSALLSIERTTIENGDEVHGFIQDRSLMEDTE